MKLTLALLTLLVCGVYSEDATAGAGANDAAATAGGDKPSTTQAPEKLPDPPNNWGTYSDLPNEFSSYEKAFSNVFVSSVSANLPKGGKSPCKNNEAHFERWYRDSVKVDEVILSYFCFPASDRTKIGYEHIKANFPDVSDPDKVTFLDYKTKLSDFGIVGAGNYPNEPTAKGDDGNGKAGKEQTRLLADVLEQIEVQNKARGEDNPICKNPSTKTLYQYYKKTENGLFYTKFPVSCDSLEVDDYPAYMMDVEVVEDITYKKVNGGEPLLVSMSEPVKNVVYLKELHEKQTASSSGIVALSVTAALVMPVAIRFF